LPDHALGGFLRTIFESNPAATANPLVQVESASGFFREQKQLITTYSIEIMKPLPKTLACVFSIAAIPAGSLTAGEKKNIVDTAVAAGSF
jgi:hypothetical protein